MCGKGETERCREDEREEQEEVRGVAGERGLPARHFTASHYCHAVLDTTPYLSAMTRSSPRLPPLT